MALVDLKSNLANFRSSFTTKPLEDTVNKGSELNIDSAPKVYNRRTAWTNARVERSELNRDSDYILKYTGRTKFTTKVIETSKLNRDSDSILKYTGRTKFTPKFITTSKFNVDSSLSKFSDSGKYTPSKYANEKALPSTPTRWLGPNAPAVNFIDDKKSGAAGFTTNANNKNTTGFAGADVAAGTYTYPTSVLGVHGSSVASLPLTNTKYPINGTGKLTNQLGNGSKFYFISDGARKDKTFSAYGYHEKNRYELFIKTNEYRSVLTLKAAETNSPSAIEEQYKKFNLRDDTNNIYDTYIKQPYVLRGIQREDKKEPQLWGIGRFDDGLIRGGATAAVERSALDTVRIAKWLASPKGLLWVAKQVGLGLTNPLVEADTIALTAGLGFRSNRVHTGIASLLSVPGSAFGLHFTRHGIPFVNELASYSSVSSRNNNRLSYEKGNRLISLKKQLFGPLSGIIGFEGAPIPKLTGLGGPNSLYGVGTTTIRRYAVTDLTAINRASEFGFTSIYNINSQYASAEFKGKARRIGPRFISFPAFSSKGEDSNKNTRDNVDVQDSSNSNERSSLFTLGTKLKDTDVTPGTEFGIGNVQLDSNTRKSNAYPSTPVNPINNYEVLAYNKIPKSTGLPSFNDFRAELSAEAKSFSSKLPEGMSYASDNLETKYGFGKLGAVNADRSNPLEYFASSKPKDSTSTGFGRARAPWAGTAFRGDKVNALDVRPVELTKPEVYPEGAKDLIEFYFEDGNEGTNVMVFRCTMTGFSDTFSPNWSRIEIMGRPDGAYLYSAFERTISFNFIAAAMSRTEMIPMWRKLNYLASYTMPDFRKGDRAAGPFMRLTIGNLFKNTPGFLNSLSYTIPDDATWDTAADNRSGEAKQLPNIIEVSVGFTIIADFRPQVKGRAYSLFAGATNDVNDWLWDSGINQAQAEKDAKKYEDAKAAEDKKAATEASKTKDPEAAAAASTDTTGTANTETGTTTETYDDLTPEPKVKL